jgi:hypothetical protein
MKQATNLHDLENPTVLPGIKLNTLMFAVSSCRHRNSLLVLQAVQHGRH